MKKKQLTIALLILLAFSSLTACYQPVDLSPAERPDIPWVHCILNEKDSLYLDLRYIDASGSGHYQPINDAVIQLQEWRKRNDDSDSEYILFRSIAPELVGEGRWLWALPQTDINQFERIKEKALCRLEIVLPSGDTLHAETTMPPGRVDQQFDHLSESYVSSFILNGKSYSYEAVTDVNNHLYKHEEYSRFLLPVNNPVWVTKFGLAEDGSTFVEETLATDRDEWTDGVNCTGQTFTKSDISLALTNYPDVAGKPLHYHFLRFPNGRVAKEVKMEHPHDDTIGNNSLADALLTISGDFKGPHFGALGSILEIARAEQIYEKTVAQVSGIPYADNILTSHTLHRAGYLEFRTVSPEYDQYLKDVAQYDLLRETDVVSIYRNTNTYTNVQGGTGIFGAAITQTFYWTCGQWVF